MGLKIANNAVSLLSVGITAADTSVTVTTGDGALFPVLSVGDYFYAALEDTSGNFEIVKVTARTEDAMTIVRGQEGTTPIAFSAGASFDLRFTAQTFFDYILATVGTATITQFTGNGGTSYGPLPSAPTDIQQAIVVVGTGVQRPTTDYSFSGANVVFTSSITAGVPILVFQFNPSSLASVLKATDIGVTVQGFDANTVKKNVPQTFSAVQKSTVTADNDLSFDLAAGMDFTCTPTGAGTLSFSNIASGQKFEVLFTNTSNYAIAKGSNIKCSSTLFTTISATGRYVLAGRCLDGTNVDLTVSGALS